MVHECPFLKGQLPELDQCLRWCHVGLTLWDLHGLWLVCTHLEEETPSSLHGLASPAWCLELWGWGSSWGAGLWHGLR